MNVRQHHKMTQSQRSKTGIQLYDNLSRKQLTNLIKLHIDHYRLNNYLNRHNIIEDLSCDCGRGIEDMKHFLLLYKKYETKKGVEEEDRGEKYENGESIRRSEISEGYLC